MAGKFVYEINGKKYTQSKLVLGQVQQLLGLLMDVRIPAVLTGPNILAALGNKLSRGFAIVLNPEGIPLKDKDLDELENEFMWALDDETAAQVVEDFFACNPIASIYARLQASWSRIGPRTSPDGSMKSA